MKGICLLSVLLFAFPMPNPIAQEIHCDAFCVKDIQIDLVTPDLMNVTLFFSSDSFAFINYPYISSVLDQFGDTIGTGTLNFFGQFGNTSQVYPVHSNIDTIPANFTATVNFYYDTSMCALPYPCMTSGIREVSDAASFTIHPNPFTTETIIQADVNLEDIVLTLFNSQGQQVLQADIMGGNSIVLRRESLPAGIYFLQFSRDHKVSGSKKIVIID